MSDLEFDILDELYFVQSFSYLEETLELDTPTLQKALISLLDKSWVKCFLIGSEEILSPEEIQMETEYQNYRYLATKEGLMAHNTR